MSKDMGKSVNGNTGDGKFDFVFGPTSAIHINLMINMNRATNPEKMLSPSDPDNNIGPAFQTFFERLSAEQRNVILTLIELYFEKVRLQATHQDTRHIDEAIRWLEQNTKGFGDGDSE